MKEHPILFSAPMVRAILDGTKTQTRRVVKPQPAANQGMVNAGYCGHPNLWLRDGPCDASDPAKEWRCPYGQPGDRLWVRETFADLRGTGIEHRPDPSGPLKRYAFAADHPPGSHGDEARKEFGVKWKPSIHMPRTASRITLEITGVRVERLQDISPSDAISEGIEREPGTAHWMQYDKSPGGWRYWESPIQSYRTLWESINGPDNWAANPWVWVVEFRALKGKSS